MGFLQELWASILKGLRIKWRSKFSLVVELLVPMFFLWFLFGAATVEKGFPVKAQYNTTSVPLPRLNETFRHCTPRNLARSVVLPPFYSLAFVPGLSDFRVAALAPLVNVSDSVNVVYFDTTKTLIKNYSHLTSSICAAIVFDTTTTDYVYTIRAGRGLALDDTALDGLLPVRASIQRALHEAIARTLTGKNTTIEYASEQMPESKGRTPPVAQGRFWAAYMPLAFAGLLPSLTTALITEKERKLKELMKIHGLSTMTYWLSWMLVQLLFTCGIMTLFTSVLFVRILNVTWVSPLLVWAAYMLFSVALISQAFVVACFVDKPRLGMLLSISVLMIGIVAEEVMHSLMFDKYDSITVPTILVSLWPTVPFGEMIFNWSLAQQRNHMRGIHSHPKYPAWFALLMLGVDAVAWFLFAWYIEQVWPSEFGASRPWYFPLLPSYWFPRGSVSSSPGEMQPLLLGGGGKKGAQLRVDSAKTGIHIVELTKDYDASFLTRLWPAKKRNADDDPSDVKGPAVDKLSLQIERGRTLVVLGHNGAGKSTTMHMLVGLVSPTEGDAYILGMSITHEMHLIRKFMGVCPQHDVLFDQLTAVEHLKLFAALKGYKSRTLDKDCRDLLLEVGLNERDGDQYPRGFSGGMKRKLCVAIALMGGSQAIFLDECTAGMDPFSRRRIWQVLQDRKAKGVSIFHTTHFLEEADLLGDDIIIMARGHIVAQGSSLQLKARYGTGYQLACVMNSTSEADIQNLHKFVQSKLPGEVHVTSSSAVEITFQLPQTILGADSATFFSELAQNATALHLRSYGLSMTTLDDVFLKVMRDAENQAL